MRALTRAARALAVRDALLPWLRANGTMEPIANSCQVLSAKAGRFRILHRTPFQKLPGPATPPRSYQEAIMERAARNLPYCLNVWGAGPPGKLMNLEWGADGAIHLAGFARGEWDGELLQAISAKQ